MGSTVVRGEHRFDGVALGDCLVHFVLRLVYDADDLLEGIVAVLLDFLI
jgi:hypothetical protein